jgi:rRNA-processing protein EBP2
MFDVALDDETKKPRTGSGGRTKDKSGANPKRQKKNEKYGFGGKKRHGKSGDAMSTSDMRDFSVKKMKDRGGAKQRPGKSRRASARS